MKKKKETKKLNFDKISIAQLDNGKMNQAKGKAGTCSVTRGGEDGPPTVCGCTA